MCSYPGSQTTVDFQCHEPINAFSFHYTAICQLFFLATSIPNHSKCLSGFLAPGLAVSIPLCLGQQTSLPTLSARKIPYLMPLIILHHFWEKIKKCSQVTSLGPWVSGLSSRANYRFCYPNNPKAPNCSQIKKKKIILFHAFFILLILSLGQTSLTHSPFTFHLTMYIYSCCL